MALATALTLDACIAAITRELSVRGNARARDLVETTQPARPPLLQLPEWVMDAGVTGMGAFARRLQSHEWQMSPVTDLAHTTSRLEPMDGADAEDTHVYERYFFGRAGGTFLEAGAVDGVRFSVTHALDKDLGWRGVLVEGSPLSAAGLFKQRPEHICIHAVLCGRPRSVAFMEHASSSPLTRGIAELMPDAYMAFHFPNVSRQSSGGQIQVKCQQLSPLLARVGIRHINYWVLDVEGAELEILEAFDWALVTFDVISVETHVMSPEARARTTSLLGSHGYMFDSTTPRNWFFVHRDYQRSTRPSLGL